MSKKWCFSFLAWWLIIEVISCGITVILDPFFHYHKPLNGLSYILSDERYQNDGILRHFDYDTIITGTSMAENFRTSECDTLFGSHSVKVPFQGATYREVGEAMERAIDENADIHTVIWALDYDRFYWEADQMAYDDIPKYLYNNNPFDDIRYIMNSTVLLVNDQEVIERTSEGKKTTSFDEYMRWNESYKFGKDEVLKYSHRMDKEKDKPFKPLERKNIDENVVKIAEEHPDIDFYMFWTPYSIVAFHDYYYKGELKNILTWEKEALHILAKHDNIHLFSFNDCFDIVCNLDNYKDTIHYGAHINTYMLKCMAEDKHGLNSDEEIESYCRKVWDFYTTYDYSKIWD